MTTDEPTLQDLFSLGPITVAANRIDPATLTQFGAHIVAQVGAAASFANVPGVASSVLHALGEALRMRLSDICIDAWNKRDELRHLDAPSEPAPPEPHVVTLGKHTVSWDYFPSVRLSANGTPLATLPFKAAVELTMSGVVLTVANRRLLRIETGTGTVHGTLHCGTLELVHKQTAPHQLPGSIEFREGLPLGSSRATLSPVPRA